MGIRENFQKVIDRKTQELRDLEVKMRELNAYIQAMQDSLKLLPRESPQNGEVELRAGSSLAKARDALRAAGKPLYITDLLKAIGKPGDKKNRLSLAGTLSSYARSGKIFTRPAPNTFGLLEFGLANSTSEGPDPLSDEELPDEFGAMQ